MVVLRSMSRTTGLIVSSRPRLNINGFLDHVTNGGTNRVSTLSISACNIGSLVNEIAVREFSSNVDESRLTFDGCLLGRSSLSFSIFFRGSGFFLGSFSFSLLFGSSSLGFFFELFNFFSWFLFDNWLRSWWNPSGLSWIFQSTISLSFQMTFIIMVVLRSMSWRSSKSSVSMNIITPVSS
jgi:hypothetical protein